MLFQKRSATNHSSMDLPTPTMLQPQIRVPSTPSMLFSFIVKFVLHLYGEMNENKQNGGQTRPGFGGFKNVFSDAERTHGNRRNAIIKYFYNAINKENGSFIQGVIILSKVIRHTQVAIGDFVYSHMKKTLPKVLDLVMSLIQINHLPTLVNLLFGIKLSITSVFSFMLRLRAQAKKLSIEQTIGRP